MYEIWRTPIVGRNYDEMIEKMREQNRRNEASGRYDYVQTGRLVDTHKHFDNREDAIRFLEDYVEKAYSDDISPYATFTFPRSGKFITIEKRLDAEKAKYEKYEKEHSIYSFSSAFVSCPFCKSKLNRCFFKERNECPLCETDMRSKTTLDTLYRYEKNIHTLIDELRAEEKAMKNAKTQRKNDARYYVALNYFDGHC